MSTINKGVKIITWFICLIASIIALPVFFTNFNSGSVVAIIFILWLNYSIIKDVKNVKRGHNIWG